MRTKTKYFERNSYRAFISQVDLPHFYERVKKVFIERFCFPSEAKQTLAIPLLWRFFLVIASSAGAVH